MTRATLTSLGPCAPMRRRYKLKLLLRHMGLQGFPSFQTLSYKVGGTKTGPGRAETKRRARSTKNAPSAPTSMPAESSAGAQTLVVAPLRAAGNQPHGNPSYHPSCNRQPDARYTLHNSIDNHHPALLSTIDTGANLIPAWPVESPHIARAREAIRTTRYKLCRALIASLTMPLLMR